jgi:hypothetical protein
VPVGRKVRVPQLALDQRERDAFMQQLDSMSMPLLMRRMAARSASHGPSAEQPPGVHAHLAVSASAPGSVKIPV